MSDQSKPVFKWKDRKRYLGLPVSFTRYAIRDQRLFYARGFFNTTEDELLLYRILDIKLDRTLGDKIVGVGTITLFTADKTNPELKLVRIKNPRKVRDLISKMVEEERIRLNIRGKELYGVSDNDHHHRDVDDALDAGADTDNDGIIDSDQE